MKDGRINTAAGVVAGKCTASANGHPEMQQAPHVAMDCAAPEAGVARPARLRRSRRPRVAGQELKASAGLWLASSAIALALSH